VRFDEDSQGSWPADSYFLQRNGDLYRNDTPSCPDFRQINRHCRIPSPGTSSSNRSGIPTTLATPNRAPPLERSRTVQSIVAPLSRKTIFAPLKTRLRADLSFCSMAKLNIRSRLIGLARIQSWRARLSSEIAYTPESPPGACLRTKIPPHEGICRLDANKTASSG
jgi:hypothetical protein